MKRNTGENKRMIEVHLYGRLRRYAPDVSSEQGTVLHVEPELTETLSALLNHLGIPLEDLYHVFVNGSLLVTHNAMAPWLVYPQAQEDISNWEMNVPLNDGDRVGLFGEDMASLVV
jgi:hypothetical protein